MNSNIYRFQYNSSNLILKTGGPKIDFDVNVEVEFVHRYEHNFSYQNSQDISLKINLEIEHVGHSWRKSVIEIKYIFKVTKMC